MGDKITPKWRFLKSTQGFYANKWDNVFIKQVVPVGSVFYTAITSPSLLEEKQYY